ncbi:unnamed protein product [Schistosoma turkestanicum]|nr:unnamed protein product [Schistosoma turkestanicum]
MNCILNSFNCIFIILSINFCQTNKYFPKRLITNSSNTHDESISNYISETKDSNYNSLAVHQCPINCFIEHESQDMLNCIPDEASTKSSKLKLISCERNTETGELVLGHKESVRGIVPGALGHLVPTSPTTSKQLSRSGQLEIHINLNMVRMDARCFQGLGGLITNVRLLNTVYMHPDSLIDLQHLRSFEIESGQTPLHLSDDYVKNGKDSQSDVEKPMEQTNKPAFIRLNPLDNTIPISFNLNTKCHRCALVDDNHISNNNAIDDSLPTKTDNLVIVVFTNKRDLLTSQHNSLKLSMIFPYTCPVIKNGIGCLGSSNSITNNQENSSEISLISNDFKSESESQLESSLLNISVIEQLKTMTYIQTESNHTLSLSILLIIWCTIITISFIIVILIVLYCSRKRFIKIPLSTRVTQITPFRLFQVCGQQNASIDDDDEGNGTYNGNNDGDMEEISSNSVSSGFFAQQPKTYIASERNELLPHTNDDMNNFVINSKNTQSGMSDTRSSWSSLQIMNNPPIDARPVQCRCSIINLKDLKPTSSNKYGTVYNILQLNKHSNQRYSEKPNNHYIYKKSHLSKRRSIGSQTDFTDIESDNPEAYCTLDRYVMQRRKRYPYTTTNNNINDHYLSKRTASNQFLPFFRNNLNQMDGIVITKPSIYSNNLFSHSSITMNNNSSINDDNNNSDHRRTHINSNDTSIAKRSNNNGTDLFILMIDDKSKSARNLPQTNPNYKLTNLLNKRSEYMKGDLDYHEGFNGSVIYSGD